MGSTVRTTGNILAGQGLDGVRDGVGVAVHADTGAIALVNFVHVERGEGCVAERQGSEEEKQGRSEHLYLSSWIDGKECKDSITD